MAKLTLPYPYFQPDRYAEVSRNRIPLPAENTPPLHCCWPEYTHICRVKLPVLLVADPAFTTHSGVRGVSVLNTFACRDGLH